MTPQAREAEGEPVVRKRTFDPFADPDATPALLDALGPARAVLVCGLVTSICVNLTAAGFYQVRDFDSKSAELSRIQASL